MDDDLRETLERLEDRLRRVERRMDEVEDALGVESEEDVTGEDTESDTVDEKAEDTAVYGDVEAEEAATETDGDQKEDEDVGEEGRSLETDVGVKWFGRVGAFAVVVGVVLFFNYAFEQGWIGPLGRVALGVAAGISLVGVGEFFSRRDGYGFWSATVKGLGVAVVYFAVYASYGLETYREALGTPLVAAVAGMTLVVAGGVALALRDGSRPLSYEAFFLGYVTALLSTEFGFGGVVYVVLLSAAVGAVVYREGWGWLSVGGAAGAYAVYLVWGPEAGSQLAAGFLVAVFAVFLSQSAAVSVRDHDVTPNLWLNVVNSVGFAALFVPVVREHGAAFDVSVTGVFLAVFAALHAGLYAVATAREAEVKRVYPYLGVVFLVAALWELLLPFGFTVSVAVVAAALFAASQKVDIPETRRAAHGVAVVAVVAALWFVDEFAAFDATNPVEPSYLVALGAVAAALYAIYVLGRRGDNFTVVEDELGVASDRPATAYVYSATAALVTVALIFNEGGDYLSTPLLVAYGVALVYAGTAGETVDLRAEAYAVTAVAVGKLVAVDAEEFAAFDAAEPLARSTLPLFVVAVVGLYAGYVVLQDAGLTEAESRVPLAYSATAAFVAVVGFSAELDGLGVSAAWAVYGLGLLALGIRAGAKDLRLEGVAVLGLATAKVFLFDTLGLSPAARIASYIILGVILLAASFAYTRYRDKIAETL